MFPIQEIAPCIFYVDGVAVVGGLVDEDTYVEIVRGFSKRVVELRKY